MSAVRPGWRIRVAILLVTLAATTTQGLAQYGWRKPGVRIWYTGMSGSGAGGGGSSSDIQQAIRIDKIDAAGAHVRIWNGMAGWTSNQPVYERVIAGYRGAGSCWMRPVKLATLVPPQAVKWDGLKCLVKERRRYTINTIPVAIKTLPIQALFAAQPKRLFITLSYRSGDGLFGQFLFDVNSGLLISQTQSKTGGNTTFLILSEINYDFANRILIPEEPTVPHTGFFASCYAITSVSLGTASFSVTGQVTSQYRGSLQVDFVETLITSGVSLPESYRYTLEWTPAGPKMYRTTYGQNDRTELGTHLPFWIPPAQLTAPSINVWGNALTNRGTDPSARTVFTVGAVPEPLAFSGLAYDANGYISDLWITRTVAPSFWVDSYNNYARYYTLTGRSYYISSMQ